MGQMDKTSISVTEGASKLFSIVVPVYKNELNIVDTVEYIHSRMGIFDGYDVELILVNDGSPDQSWELMKGLQKKYPDLLRIASFTRNFGQSAAINCGMSLAKGEVVGVISADLQDPFDLFAKMLQLRDEGNKLVFAYRESRGEKGLGAFCSRLMHRIVHKFVNGQYPPGGFDFFVADRELVDRYLACDKIPGGMQLLLLWFGYDFVSIPYRREKRKKGKSSWSLTKKLNAAFRWIALYSTFLLRGILLLGTLLLGIGVVTLICSLVFTALAVGLVSVMVILTGLILVSGGILGEYISKILDYEKGLPRYVVKEVIES